MYKEFSEISENSKVPKYQQLLENIINDIEEGLIKIGERLPSINETSEEYYLSRDTVSKAYELLRKRSIITAVKGKGYYVSCTARNPGKKLLLVFSKLSDRKKMIYNSLVNNLPEGTVVDLLIHHADSSTLEKIIIENLGKYDHYLIMPHLKEETESVKAAINKIPKRKLVLIDTELEGIEGDYACVYEDFEMDIFHALSSGLKRIQKYQKLILVFPALDYCSTGIKKGFKRFCSVYGFEWEICSLIKEKILPGELFVIIDESDLVELIKRAGVRNLILGSDIGIIAYNNTPFKEILSGGISVLSTDFEEMGKNVAEIVLNKSKRKVKNPFSLIVRNSV